MTKTIKENQNHKTKTKNNTLLFFEIVFSIFVIFIHVEIELSGFEIFFNALGRTTVLLFFMISGFFYCKKCEKMPISEMYKVSFAKMLRLALFALITLAITFLYKIAIECKFDHILIVEMLRNHFTLQNLLDFLVFGNVDVANHLWFVFCLIIVYSFSPFLIKIIQKQPILLLFSSFIILTCVYFFTWFFLDFVPLKRNFIVTRNWLFEGVPAFLIGGIICIYLDKLVNYLRTNRMITFSFFLLIFAFIFVDAFLNYYFKTNVQEFYLFSPVLAAFIIIFSFAYPSMKIGKLAHCVFGSRCSTIIYLFHPLICHIVTILLYRLTENNIALYFLSFSITLMIALLLSASINFVAYVTRKNFRHE